ncbi:hypothetical protein SBOR_8812 [Sclerotinia borealis F-4128]|uniref:Ferric reductase NAD binding domain-containing protein n=1 Tax=Sclerotinia borealis (strain F-4128) TaxID=1432307 RepID=W9C218_SCLBF|nr:hypothetical protein SBOR_8812 [Sclerotinia borealis F-4128]
MSDVISRAGIMASVNLIPLFLGGWTNALANFIGISIHSYYIAHHWIGRVVIVQSLLHVALVLAAGQLWTFNSSQISGISVSCISIVALTRYVTILFVEIDIIYYNLGGVGHSLTPQADIFHFYDGSKTRTVNAIRLTVLLRRPMKINPGQYMYLFLSDMGVSFLIEPSNGITSKLIGRGSLCSVVMDGPYGKDLRLEDFETVILVAKGIGIAGIIPYVRSLTYRKVNKDKNYDSYGRGLITRKIDLYWVLDDNCQEDWISDWLVDLQMRDSEKVVTAIYLISVQRSAGKSKVAVCGTSGFIYILCNIVIQTLKKYKDIEFAEVEYQPHRIHHIYSRVTSKNWDQIEMETTNLTSQLIARGRHLQRSQLGDTERKLESNKDRLVEWRPDDVQDWDKINVNMCLFPFFSFKKANNIIYNDDLPVYRRIDEEPIQPTSRSYKYTFNIPSAGTMTINARNDGILNFHHIPTITSDASDGVSHGGIVGDLNDEKTSVGMSAKARQDELDQKKLRIQEAKASLQESMDRLNQELTFVKDYDSVILLKDEEDLIVGMSAKARQDELDQTKLRIQEANASFQETMDRLNQELTFVKDYDPVILLKDEEDLIGDRLFYTNNDCKDLVKI